MSSYAHVNLLELDDATGGRVEGLEGRFGRTHLLDDQVVELKLWDVVRVAPEVVRDRRGRAQAGGRRR